MTKKELSDLISRIESNLKIARACELGVVLSQRDVALILTELKGQIDGT